MSGETPQNIKILVVDDDQNIAEILVDIVSAKERAVDVCHNGLDAVESIQNNMYDLIIVDLVMPKVGGLAPQEFMELDGNAKMDAALRMG
ncbi:MAG: response regulator [Dehalococcoidales bacterium]|nr:response regulator [Dehalococcoidales bacterium]